MLDQHDNRTYPAPVSEVLTALRKNLEEHEGMVKEARAGFIKKAQEELAARIEQLKEGKLVRLDFSLRPPQSHASDFKTVIKTLELMEAAFEAEPGNTERGAKATVQLKPIDVQRFVLNNWSWTREFLTSNRGYSPELNSAFLELPD